VLLTRDVCDVPRLGMLEERCSQFESMMAVAVAWLVLRASSVPQVRQPATNTGAVQPNPRSRWRTIRPLTADHPRGQSGRSGR
jgi:hypothetical protein